ncbi:MAG: fibronectin type III domain-containing protein [Myxococcales bacterium]
MHQACVAGVCIGVCAPGELRCDGQTPQSCDPSGGWRAEPACVHQTCVGGTCGGVCAPDELKCDGQTPQACDGDGLWASGAACAHQVCVAGACTGLCAPGELQCDGQLPQACDASGAWVNGTVCDDQTCVAGLCAGVCAPGAVRCSGQTPQSCDPSGAWKDGATCVDQTCVDGACRPNDLPPTLPATPTLAFSGVSSNGLTVTLGEAADDDTAREALQYRVVYSVSASAYSTAAAVAAAASDVALDWAAGGSLGWSGTTDRRTDVVVTGLTEGTTYTFWAVVRDQAGNLSLYSSASQATIDMSPVVGTLSFGPATGTTLVVRWSAATDGNTPASELYYKLVRGPGGADLSTLALAEAATPVLDFTAGALTATASGLSVSTTYTFAVIVREGTSGPKALYTPQACATTTDTTPPTLPTPATLSFPYVSIAALEVAVPQAWDDVTVQGNLRYKLVYATSPTAYVTPADVAAATSNVIWDWKAGSSLTWRALVSPLLPGTTYSFFVVVRDEAGNMSLYTTSSVATVAQVSIGEIAAGTGLYRDGSTISYGKTFSAAPYLLVNGLDASSKPLIAGVRSESGVAPSTTGFTLKLHDLDNNPVSTPATVQWLAILPAGGRADVIAGRAMDVVDGQYVAFPRASSEDLPIVLVSAYDESVASPVLSAPYNVTRNGFTVGLKDADGNPSMAHVTYLAVVPPSNYLTFANARLLGAYNMYSSNQHLGMLSSLPPTVILASAQKNVFPFAAAARNVSQTGFDLSLLDYDGAPGTNIWVTWCAFALP